jgi:DNA modification methylase
VAEGEPVTAVVLRGDAAALPLPDGSVDLIVTSPPYFGLRSYSDGGQHYSGQVGDEATPAEYLDALTACTAEWGRVLKPGGSIFVNLGDKYANAAPSGTAGHKSRTGYFGEKWDGVGETITPMRTDNLGIRTKSLMGMPWRYAIRCVDQLGLILRAEIIWSKPNGLPESVTDRVRRSHEQVFHLVKQPRYYSAVDEVRTEHVASWAPGRNGGKARASLGGTMTGLADSAPNPLGALPGSVWTIATAPLTVPEHLGVDHFAAFPPELVKRIVAGWSPRQVCTACGEGRRPVAEAQRTIDGRPAELGAWTRGGIQQAAGIGNWRFGTDRRVTGYACGCADTTAPTTPGTVLDPFGGTGTTALVASCLGRVGITIDMSADYCRLARWRTSDPGERARVLEVPKPEKPVDGQLGLFEGLGA